MFSTVTLHMHLHSLFSALIRLSVLVSISYSPMLHGEVLDIEFYEQEYSDWCWAAVTTSVIELYTGSAPPQCEIAAYGLNGGLVDETGECCNMKDGYFSDALCNAANELYDHPGSISDILNAYEIPHTILEGPLSFDELADDIDAKRPFIIHWTMMPGIGHFVLGYGYEETPFERVLFSNPSPDAANYDDAYSWVISGTNSSGVTHYWAHTLLLSEPAPTEIREDAGTSAPLDSSDIPNQTHIDDSTENGSCAIQGIAAHHSMLFQFVTILVFFTKKAKVFEK